MIIVGLSDFSYDRLQSTIERAAIGELTGRSWQAWPRFQLQQSWCLYQEHWRTMLIPGDIEISFIGRSICCIEPIGIIAELFGKNVPTAYFNASISSAVAVHIAVLWRPDGRALIYGVSNEDRIGSENSTKMYWRVRRSANGNTQTLILKKKPMAYMLKSFCIPTPAFKNSTGQSAKRSWGSGVLCPQVVQSASGMQAIHAAAQIGAGDPL